MNPRAPLRSTSAPNSDASRLDVSTIAGELPFEVSTSATPNPSMSGSWMSSRTTSGRRRRAVSIALCAVLGLADDLESLGLEQRSGRQPEARVVVDDEDGGRHVLNPGSEPTVPPYG